MLVRDIARISYRNVLNPRFQLYVCLRYMKQQRKVAYLTPWLIIQGTDLIILNTLLNYINILNCNLLTCSNPE